MRYLLILIVTLTLTGEAMGNYNKNLSDRHPQVKVKTFSNNEGIEEVGIHYSFKSSEDLFELSPN